MKWWLISLALIGGLAAVHHLRVQRPITPQTLYLTWDDLSDPAPFTVEYEVWHSSVLTSNQFTMLAVVPFIGCRVTNNGVLEYFICRSRYTYDTNQVSDWNKP